MKSKKKPKRRSKYTKSKLEPEEHDIDFLRRQHDLKNRDANMFDVKI